VLDDFTPLVERISIDEAFADVAGCTHLLGSPADIAGTIRHRVRTELGLPISIGVARTKHVATIASQVAKADGLVVVDPDTKLAFLHDLPVELMWGVGPATKARRRPGAKRGMARWLADASTRSAIGSDGRRSATGRWRWGFPFPSGRVSRVRREGALVWCTSITAGLNIASIVAIGRWTFGAMR
jgi:hypothetical protein